MPPAKALGIVHPSAVVMELHTILTFGWDSVGSARYVSRLVQHVSVLGLSVWPLHSSPSQITYPHQQNILTSPDHAYWRSVRKAVTPAFSTANLK